tara:strand:+ start:134 stop:436 length:303 start_codon:yes stop_codon:yes gene_type:complete
MAKFISIRARSTASATIGDVLIAAEGIITTDTLTDSTTAIYYDNKTVTLTYNETFLFNTSVRDSINAALLADPIELPTFMGVASQVELPAGIVISSIAVS